MLQSCDNRWEVSKAMFEMACVHMHRATYGWQRRMEDAATLLTRTISSSVSLATTFAC